MKGYVCKGKCLAEVKLHWCGLSYNKVFENTLYWIGYDANMISYKKTLSFDVFLDRPIPSYTLILSYSPTNSHSHFHTRTHTLSD